MPAYSTFNSVLIDRMDKSSADRLYQMEDGSYIYKGKVTNNYCLYNNNLYRIVGINSNGTTVLVSEECVTAMAMNCQEDLNDTYLYQWLNITDQENSGVFERVLRDDVDTEIEIDNEDNIYDDSDERESVLSFSMAFYGKIEDLSSISNDDPFTDGKVTILSMLDYANCGGKDSFLNNGEMFWLSNQDSEGNYYYVCEDGSVSSGYPTQQICGIRPVITLKSTTVVEQGDGKINNPYLIESISAENVDDLNCGSYVSYSSLTWRVTTADEFGTYAILDGVIMDGEQPLQMAYGNSTKYNLSNGVGKYLNNDFLSSLENYKDYLVEYSANFGDNGDENYSYLNDYQHSLKCYVSLPTMGCFFLNEYQGYYLSSFEGGLFVYMVNDGFFYENVLSQKAALRPIICFNNDLKIASGNGTIESPYVLTVGGGE